MRSWIRRPAEMLRVASAFFRNLVVRRHLVWNFVVRDLKGRYIGSLMGFFWAVVHPLVLLASYTFVFSVVFKARVPGPLPDNFAVFLFCGILPWLYFQDTLLRSCTSVVDHGNLIKKSIFPSEILPVTIVVSNLVTHLVGFIILVTVLVFFIGLSWFLLLIPVYLLLLAVLSLGLGWLLASLQVFLRDTSQVLSVVLVFWFWFTPIFYPLEAVPEPYRFFVGLNPVGFIVDGYRDLLLLQRMPNLGQLLWLALAAFAAFFAGGVVFRNTKREFIDVL